MGFKDVERNVQLLREFGDDPGHVISWYLEKGLELTKKQSEGEGEEDEDLEKRGFGWVQTLKRPAEREAQGSQAKTAKTDANPSPSNLRTFDGISKITVNPSASPPAPKPRSREFDGISKITAKPAASQYVPRSSYRDPTHSDDIFEVVRQGTEEPGALLQSEKFQQFLAAHGYVRQSTPESRGFPNPNNPSGRAEEGGAAQQLGDDLRLRALAQG
jgi:hypothetical protein